MKYHFFIWSSISSSDFSVLYSPWKGGAPYKISYMMTPSEQTSLLALQWSLCWLQTSGELQGSVYPGLCSGLGVRTCLADIGMVGLPKINEFDEEVTVDHDVIGLEIQMNYAVISDVTQGLGDGEDQVELGEHGDSVAVGPEVFFEVFEGDEVHDYCLAEEAFLVDSNIVLRQENRQPILDAFQDLNFMTIATPASSIHILLDNHILMQRGTAFPILLIQPLMPLRRVHVLIIYLRDVDLRKTTLVDLVVVHLADIVDEDVVQDHVVLEGVFVALLHRHCDHRADVFQLLKRQLVILLFVWLVVLEERALLVHFCVAGQPTFHALSVLQYLLDVNRSYSFLLSYLSLSLDIGLIEMAADGHHLHIPVIILPNLLDLVFVTSRQFVLVGLPEQSLEEWERLLQLFLVDFEQFGLFAGCDSLQEVVEEIEDGEVRNEAAIVFVETDIDQPCICFLDSDLVVPGHVVVLATVLHPEVETVGHRKGKKHLKRPPPLVQSNAEDGLISLKDCTCDCIKLIETTVLSLELHQNLLNLPDLAFKMMHHLLLLTPEGKVVVRPGEAQFLAQQQSIQLLVGQQEHTHYCYGINQLQELGIQSRLLVEITRAQGQDKGMEGLREGKRMEVVGQVGKRTGSAYLKIIAFYLTVWFISVKRFLPPKQIRNINQSNYYGLFSILDYWSIRLRKALRSGLQLTVLKAVIQHNLNKMLRDLSPKETKDVELIKKALDSIRAKKPIDEKNSSINVLPRSSQVNDFQPSEIEIKKKEKEKKGKYHRLMIGISHQINRSLIDQRQNNINHRADRPLISFLSTSQHKDSPVSKSKKIVYMRKNQQKEKIIAQNTFKTQPNEVSSLNDKKRVFYLSIQRTPHSREGQKSQHMYHLPHFENNQENGMPSSTMRYLKQCISKAKNKHTKVLSSPSNYDKEATEAKSIISAFPQPTPIKYKSHKSTKDDSIFDQIHNYVMTNKMKEMQRSLVIECKKQDLIKKNAERYKIEQKINRRCMKAEAEKKLHSQQRKLDSQVKRELTTKIIIKRSQIMKPIQRKATKSYKTFEDFLNSKQNLTVYEQKIKSYRQLLFLVNMAHKKFDPIVMIDYLLPSKTEKIVPQKYQYYIGHGNNCKLIRALMKRRPWWVQCSDAKEAHFAWTQIKIAGIFANQPERKSSFPVLPAIEETINEQYLNQQDVLLRSSQQMPKEYIFKPPFAVKDYLKILTPRDGLVYRDLLNALSFTQFDHFPSRLKHLPQSLTEDQQPRRIMHNHLQFNQCLGNKKALFYHLTFYYKITVKPISTAFPQTYHVRSMDNDPNFKDFQAQFTRLSHVKSIQNIWIIKPGENSNRGSGINVFNDIRRLKYFIKGEKYKDGQPKTYIIQKYIEKPLLYQGRKFDIRHYMTITFLHGQLRAYWFGEGYIRTSSYPFTLLELEDSMIHLTNDAIQKKSRNYGSHQEGNKISYIELQRYFDRTYPFRNFDFKIIYAKMRELAKDAVRSTYFSLTSSRKMHNFEVFGLDFMVDDQFKVHLIEINTNPCLELSSGLLGRIIPLMVDQSLRVSLDAIFPPNMHYTNNSRPYAPDCSLEKLQFQLIFDEIEERSSLEALYGEWRQEYEQMMINLSGSEQDDQTFDNQGEEVQIDSLMI